MTLTCMTLAKLDDLLESGHNDPSPMDKAEYQVHTNKLVQGTVELLRHLAMHDVLALETAESIELIKDRQVSALAIDANGAFSDEIVGIGLPPHLVPYGAIVETLKSWNIGTIETTADLAVLARTWQEYLDADETLEDSVLHAWAGRASEVARQVLPSVERIVASGLLEVKDARTGAVMHPAAATFEETELSIILHVRSKPVPVSRSRPRSTKKTQRLNTKHGGRRGACKPTS